MSRPQSAPAVPAPQKWEFDKMPNQTGHVQKNRMYYRRGVTNSGCYWTDLYHTPQSRLKFVNYRPDLDQEHQKYVQSRKEVESQQYNAEIQRRIKRKQKIRRKFQARQGSNYKKAIPNTQLRAAPPSTQRSSKSKRPGRPKGNRVKPAYPVQKIIKKDQAYYRRRGNLWNDLAHTPRSRLHLVVTPEVIQGDALCVENMQKDADQKEKQHLYAVMAHEERVKELRSNLGIREAERVEKKCGDAKCVVQNHQK